MTRSPEVRKREVVFESEGIELAGTLLFPEGAEAGPAAVVVQQGGTRIREAPLYRQTAELLVQLGNAVLLYDRCGFGASGRAPEDRSYPVLAAEAEADVTIDQSAFSALDLYIDRLRGQGLVPDPGSEDGGAAARPYRVELIRR